MDNLYSSLEEKYGLPSGLLSAVRTVESKGDSKAVSPKGAKGDFQFMPDTAKAYGVDVGDPVSSAHGAARYLSDLIKQYGGVQAALAHYNGGTKSGLAVAQNKDAPYQETRDYLGKVNKNIRIDPSQIQFGEDTNIDSSKIQMDGGKEDKIDPSKVVIDQAQVKVDKTQEPSNTELFAKGVGKSFVDLGHGAKQLLDIPAQFLERQFKDSAVGRFGKTMGIPTAEESAAQTQRAVDEERKASEPIMNTLAGQAGYIGGNIAQMAIGGGLLKGAGYVGAGSALANPQTYKTAGAVGALQGALQPITGEESRTFNTIAGGAMGQVGLGVVNALGRIAQPIQGQIGSIADKAVQTLREAGVPLDAAQATGSKLLGRVKAALSDNPITVGAQEEFSGAQKQAYNQAIAKTMGEDATHITPDVIQTAKNRLGAIYDDVASRNAIHYDDALKNNLANIRGEAEQVLNPTQFATVEKQIQNIITKAEEQGGNIYGEQYQAIKKVLDRLGKSTDTDVGAYARELKDTLLDGLTRTAKETGNEADVKLLLKTNKEYGNMKKIEDVVLQNPEGNISPSLLLNSLATKGKRYTFFQDDPQLAKLAAAGKIVLPEKTPNSGTAARLIAQAIPAAVGGAAYGVYEGDLTGAAKGATAGILAPKLAQKAINNPAVARYLEQGIGQTQIRNMLEAPKKYGAQRLAPAATNAYIQSLPPEQPYRVELRNMLPNRP